MTIPPEEHRLRVADWAREIGRIPSDAGLRVTERACSRSGHPPFEVVFEVWDGTTWHERVVHKRLERVTRLDVLGAWRNGDACCGP